VNGRVAIFARREWQMSLGERAALEGVVSQLKPDLLIEIGAAQGGSLERIAAHSGEVHTIDLVEDPLLRLPANATFHKGDSKRLLPELLASFAEQGRNVDFVLVDGDHSQAGAGADLAALLDSPALARTLILVHDSFHPDVRAALTSMELADHPRVAGWELDFVPGRLAKHQPFAGQLWGGFALVVAGGPRQPDDSDRLGLWGLEPRAGFYEDWYPRVRPRLPPAQRLRTVLGRAKRRAVRSAR